MGTVPPGWEAAERARQAAHLQPGLLSQAVAAAAAVTRRYYITRWQQTLESAGVYAAVEASLTRALLVPGDPQAEDPSPAAAGPADAQASIARVVARSVQDPSFRRGLAKHVALYTQAWALLTASLPPLGEPGAAPNLATIRTLWQSPDYLSHAVPTAVFDYLCEAMPALITNLPACDIDPLDATERLRAAFFPVSFRLPLPKDCPAPQVARSARHTLSDAIPQYTGPEFKVVAMAAAHGPHGSGWVPAEGQSALRFTWDGLSHEVLFAPDPSADFLGFQPTIPVLWEALKGLGLPAALVLHAVLDSLLDTGRAFLALDDLIDVAGLDPRSSNARRQARQEVWRWLVTFSSWQVIGRRKGYYRSRETGEYEDLTTVGQLFVMTERAYGPTTQLDLADQVPPEEVEVVASRWLNNYRTDPRIMSYFGDIRKLSRIPGGKASGAWARAIGMALNQLWRERAATAVLTHTGQEPVDASTVSFRPFTRRELLTLFPPTPTVHEILNGVFPRRARDYWAAAIDILKAEGVIDRGYQDPTTQWPHRNWAQQWLNEPLHIVPHKQALLAIATIAERALRHRTARRGRRSRRQPPSDPAASPSLPG